MSEIIFASALSNPKIRTLLKQYTKEIEWEAKIAKEIVNFIDDRVPPGQFPQLGELRGYLSKNNHGMEEIEQVLKSVKDFIVMPTDSIDGFLGDFNKFYCNKKLKKVFENDNFDPLKIVSEIKGIETIKGGGLPLINLGNCNIKDVVESEIGDMDIIPSGFNFIQNATPWGGYLRGQLVMVTAPPGVGKSTFLLNEAITFMKYGLKVYWIALGDMMVYDFISRSTSIIKNLPFSTIANNINEYFDDEVRNITKNLRLTVLPADTVGIEDLIEFIETVVAIDENPDVIILDYDSNVKSAKTSDLMFYEGKEVYNVLAKATRPLHNKYRLGMIANQPKIQYWGMPKLPKESASESSGRQAVVDMMITIGREYKVINKHAGYLYLAKARRGKEGSESTYVLNDCGLFKEIPKDEYLLMRTHEGK